MCRKFHGLRIRPIDGTLTLYKVAELVMKSGQYGAAERHFYQIFHRLCISPIPRNCRSAPAQQCFRARRQITSAALKRTEPQFILIRHGLGSQLSSPKQWLGHRQHSTNVASPTENDALSLSSHVRRVMRHVPHPVVVITASEPSAESGIPKYSETTLRGMTASSFNTVALEPIPIVSFNVKTPSTTYDAMNQQGTFLVHFLSASQAGAKIADAFTKGRAVLAFEDLAKSRTVVVYFGGRTDGAPLLAGEGVTKVLRCRMLKEKCVEVGDHVVVLGEVLGIINPILESEGDGDEAGTKNGLIYADQRYRKTGSEIEMTKSSVAVTTGLDAMQVEAQTKATI